jgi:hypothetical protein
MNSGDSMVRELVHRFREFDAPYQEHVKDNDGELLPHVLFWDFTQIIVQSFTERAVSGAMDWRGALFYLEESYIAGDRYLREIVGTSFLESLPFPHESGYGIVKELPPTLASVFRTVRPRG